MAHRGEILMCFAVLIAANPVCGAARAEQASSPPAVSIARLEPAVGLTVNGLAADVNARPRCLALELPCTHDEPTDWGGFGLDASLAVNVTRHIAVVGTGSFWWHEWDSFDSLAARHPEADLVRAYLAGLRIGTGFMKPTRRRQESYRIFGQIQMGPERTTVFPTRRIVQVSAGVDTHGLLGTAGRVRELTLRMEVDFVGSPSGAEGASGGFRFLFGFVFGPRFGDR